MADQNVQEYERYRASPARESRDRFKIQPKKKKKKKKPQDLNRAGFELVQERRP